MSSKRREREENDCEKRDPISIGEKILRRLSLPHNNQGISRRHSLYRWDGGTATKKKQEQSVAELGQALIKLRLGFYFNQIIFGRFVLVDLIVLFI